jgi:redox-sensitive bicupin YhaK (pirin superfamily)
MLASMSNLDRTPTLTRCGGLADVAPQPVAEVFTGREVLLGEATNVRRLLPNLGRRMVGPWCFTDHYGPDDIADAAGMQVPPHPHIGLQTVSWLLEGEVRHRDSLGNDQVLTPGTLGLMTSGHGISHAEHSPVAHPRLLHGVQLWVALPDGARSTSPSWEFHGSLPAFSDARMAATVIMGELGGERSPGTAHSPIVGADVTLEAGADVSIPIEREFEHGVLMMSGTANVEGTELNVGSMLYLGCGRRELRFRCASGARLLLLGGEPFGEQIVMWWNFVARSDEEIAEAREQWIARSARFGDVHGAGQRLEAPPMPPGRLIPGGPAR